MNYSTFIDEIVEKYSYGDNVRRAIEITIPLMVKKYGEHRLDDILNVFRDVRIFTIDKLENERYEAIEKEMTTGINEHIKIESETDYGNDIIPSSTYGYIPIYDEKMNIVGERRWIVVQEMTDFRQNGYEELFGTNINIPYFIHELGHAFGMQKPEYRQEGNRIYAKHGMYETIDEITIGDDERAREIRISGENLLVEELVNEKAVQDMLVDFFNSKDYSEVNAKLNDIGHGSSNYGPTLMSLAEHLELRIGTENLIRWRMDNDTSIKDNFNDIARTTEIAATYFPGEEPFAYFASKAHQIYLDKCNCYSMTIDEYRQRNLVGFLDAMAPICAYREGIGEKDFNFYASIRKERLPDEQVMVLASDSDNKAL